MNAKTFLPRAAFLSALFSACAVVNSAHAVNLLINPGFETGNFSGWTQSGNTGFTNVTQGLASPGIGPHSGNFYASFGPVGTPGFISQTVATTVGGTYDVSYWLANQDGTPNEFQVLWNGVPVASQALVNAPAFGYTLFSASGLVATSASTTISFGFQQNPAFWGFDDASVDARAAAGVPDAGGTIVLSGLALLGMAFLRRMAR